MHACACMGAFVFLENMYVQRTIRKNTHVHVWVRLCF